MAEKKTKIVLDADVINHFVKGGLLDLLPQILPEFQYIVLDVVRKELPIIILSALDKHMKKHSNIQEEVFGQSSGEKKRVFPLDCINWTPSRKRRECVYGILPLPPRCGWK